MICYLERIGVASQPRNARICPATNAQINSLNDKLKQAQFI